MVKQTEPERFPGVSMKRVFIGGFMDKKKYCEMDNTEIRKITYENCPLKCTSCEALCDEMPVGQCRKNLSTKFDSQ